jgi:Spy/CpxP family protein refolding chaperone
MRKFRTGANFKDLVSIVAAAALFLLGGAATWADAGKCGGHNTSMGGGGCMGMDQDTSFGKRGLRPHNAAEHYLTMHSFLNFTDAQVAQLLKLRDAYIDKNATAEEKLKAAYDDLSRTLYADGVDMKSVNALLDQIGKLESQLWRAYAQQLHDIRAMLTPEQKDSLTQRWENAHRDMGGMRGGMHADMPMHHGSMPAQ